MAVAPPALVTLTDQFKARHDRPKSYVMGGIVGDAAHMSPPEGYHVSYNDLGGHCSAYGLSFTGDCAAGKAHPTYASAWDLSMNDADMIIVTTRLINAAKAKDPRVAMCWEIAGTTNGRNVHAYYLNSNTDDPTNKQQWASSHMHHVHISFRRDHVTDLAKLAPLLDVICGVPLHPAVIPAPEREKRMIVVSVDRKTVPAGRTWPGVFTFTGVIGAGLVHIVDAESEKGILEGLGQPTSAPISWNQYVAWGGK